jgi:hypothetical protein
MKSSLTIKDLPVTDDLSHEEMAEIHGGEGKSMNQVVAETLQLLHDIADDKVYISPKGTKVYY